MGLRALLLGLTTISVVPLGSLMSHAQGPPAAASNAPSANSAPAPAAAGPSAADASNQAQKAITAINNAAGAVSKASDAVTKAGTYTKTIQDITGSTAKSTQSVTDNLQTLEATDAIQQNNLLNLLTAALKDLDPRQTGTPESAVSDACAALKQPTGGDQPDVTNVLAKCATAQKDAAPALAAVTPALTGLQAAMQRPFRPLPLVSATCGS